MKILTGYKSLLLVSGLLLICPVDLRTDQVRMNHMLTICKTHKKMVYNKSIVDGGGRSYIKEMAGKLFPVLKSLTPM